MAALPGRIIHPKIAPDEDNVGLKEADNTGSKDSQLGSKGQRGEKRRGFPVWANLRPSVHPQTTRKGKLCPLWRLLYCHGYKVI